MNAGYTPQGYRLRAEETARLAGLTQDRMLQAELLKLHQTYLVIAERLDAASPQPFCQRFA
jgi:hypothetical protein